MKISYHWLKDYLPVDLPVEKAADILTNIGLEVEGIETFESVKGGLEGLIVGHVKAVEQHPNADKLRITRVDIGNGGDLQIVCGAPNVVAGQKVVVAPVGSTIYPTNGEAFKIKKAKIRGEESIGMICAEDEIGLGSSHDGIMILPEETVAGTPVKDHFNIQSDHILEIGLTPNRSDAMSHIGVARDLAAALQVHEDLTADIRMPSVDAFAVDHENLPIEIVVENVKDCPRYSGVTIQGVTVADSPEWLQQKLRSIGLNPINNIVDITNFVLHETGQPLHAFDYHQVKGNKVVVKNQPEGTTFQTLDDEERKLHAEDLMICNAEEGMCMAGVFGGKRSGVSDTTRDIFLESAYFHPDTIRKTATRHNLRTDAAMHFEKGMDPNITIYALKRAAILIKEIAGGSISSTIKDNYPQTIEPAPVTLRYDRLTKLTGMEIPGDLIRQILSALGITIQQAGEDQLNLLIPTYKADVKREVDVIEEVLRIYGFNNIRMPSAIRSALVVQQKPDREKLYSYVANYLASAGFREMMGLSITRSTYYPESGEGNEQNLVKLLNFSNVDLDVLRPDMLFGALETVHWNQNRQQNNLKLFEFGRTYTVNNDNYQEDEHLTLCITGSLTAESWKKPVEASDFYFLKAYVENILHKLGISVWQSEAAKSPQLSSGSSYHLGNQTLATFGSVSQALLDRFQIKQAVFYADLNWRSLIRNSKQDVAFRPLVKYPAIRRDLALVLDQSVTFEQVSRIARGHVKKILRDINLFDIFKDEKKLGAGKKSYAVSFIFQHAERTLTDKEIDKIMTGLEKAMENELQAIIRR